MMSDRQELCLAVVDQDSFAAGYPWVWLLQGSAAQHPAVSSVLIPNAEGAHRVLSALPFTPQ